MDDDDGDAVGIAALLHIDPMPARHVEHALVKRVQRGVKDLRGGLGAGELFHGMTIQCRDGRDHTDET